MVKYLTAQEMSQPSGSGMCNWKDSRDQSTKQPKTRAISGMQNYVCRADISSVLQAPVY